MIKLTFEFQGELGEIELQQLAGYRDRDDILDSIGTSEIEYCIIEQALKQLDSDVDPTPQMYACVRGGKKRNIAFIRGCSTRVY
ncbi:hypothetical protein C4D02_RS21885 [Vibrio parahaemolyticus]|uniref:hypothetical protein n=1 Tax=Vibrio diabolicus TaxID=50719 RepID=UPI00111219D2|nr:hypothetical protein [Vibrio diabolicus]EGR3150045.1 hypothetical protein [Vibrio parahaemolyticus]EGR3164289.1 hypothetical protein [Vibrio parahaemolyticus]EJG0321717.1 hypothetical protein [Vibrio parahaemolyticus]EJG0431750.1 hypothetical protein [Vibrio parahaemolyticus]TNC13214.1 hypothetical protein FHG74_03790 [Vibrio diabolicus]